MNREILFRGKRKQDGLWCHGDLVRIKDGDTQMSCIYYFGEVYPESIGQFTGVYDKNGDEIYEGDIVKIAGDSNNDDWKNVNYIAQIVFLDGGFCAIDGTIDNYSFRRYSLSRCEFDLEVIGNTYDGIYGDDKK